MSTYRINKGIYQKQIYFINFLINKQMSKALLARQLNLCEIDGQSKDSYKLKQETMISQVREKRA